MSILDFTPVIPVVVPDANLPSRQALAAAAREAHQRQLTTAKRGVMSMRLPKSDQFLITSFGSSFEDLGSGYTCLIDATGTLLQGNTGLELPPETRYHLQSYAVRADICAIAHLYPSHVSAYARQGKVFDLVTDTARRVIKEVLRVQCSECISRFCGLCSCRTDIRRSYTGVNVLLLRDDGMVTLGTSLEDALNLAHLAEETARESFGTFEELRN
ncbi:MAG: class II aldolase/adducin family protein [Desulfofustis sp.]|nr:class II aldolase/adducin family protein [Desulfofustis sp.]